VLAGAALLVSSPAFLPAPAGRALRGEQATLAATGALALATTPGTAEAFVYKGKEYFDITFGISPLAWGTAFFLVIYCSAILKNALQKYNVPMPTKPIKDPSGFVKQLEENGIGINAANANRGS